METNKESPFVREIENRLNALFGEEAGRAAPKSAEIKIAAGNAGNDDAGGGKEDRVAGFAEKGGSPVTETVGPDRNADVLQEAADERGGKEDRFEKIFGALTPSRPAPVSPLKDLKSIILSLEWEIDDSILSKFDEELVRLDGTFSNDQVVLGFLRILRFLGRYVRVRGTEADPGSVLLLMSAYDDLERILLSLDMTVAERRSIFLECIRKYREWADGIDLDKGGEKADRAGAAAEPRHDAAAPAPASDEKTEDAGEHLPAADSEDKPAAALPPAKEYAAGMEEILAAIRGMTPHEAIAYAVADMKKTLREEMESLRGELNVRK